MNKVKYVLQLLRLLQIQDVNKTKSIVFNVSSFQND